MASKKQIDALKSGVKKDDDITKQLKALEQEKKHIGWRKTQIR